MSIRSKLITIISTLIVSSIIATTIFAYFYASNMFINSSTNELLSVNKKGMEIINIVIEKESTEVRALSRVKTIHDFALNCYKSKTISTLSSKINETLSDYVKAKGYIEHSFIVDNKGTVIADSDETLIGTNLEKYKYVKDTLIGIDSISDTQTSPVTGFEVMIFTSAIIENDKVIGFAASAVYNENISKYLRSMKIDNSISSYAYLVDSSGQYLYHPVKKNIGKAISIKEIQSLLGNYDTLSTAKIIKYKDEGKSKVASYTFVKSIGCLLVFCADNDEILAPIINMIKIIININILIMLLASFIGGMLSSRITQPLMHLSKSADIIASGDLSNRISIDSKDEIGHLALSFNNMIDALSKAYQSLEKDAFDLDSKNKEIQKYSETLEERVAKRTADYNKANNELITKNKELTETIDLLKKTQEQLIEAEKMASLGNLVAGVAHEINTPIGTTLLSATYVEKLTTEFLQKLYEGKMTKHDFEVYMENINETIRIMLVNLNKAAELVKTFKLVSIDQSSQLETLFNLKEEVDAFMLSLNVENKIKIARFTNNIEANILLYSYPHDFLQVFHSLFLNSVQHGIKDNEKIEIFINCSIENDKIKILYEDNGIGISPEISKRIFEPFFTTSRHSGNLGLGLNIAYNIITQKLHGTIYCQKPIDKGVRFVIEIPATLLA